MKVYESTFAVAISAAPYALASARQISHDTLIASTGRARRSGVSWSYYPTVDAQKALTEDGSDIVLPPDALMLCDLFPGGRLVVATVEVDPKITP